MRAMNGKWLVAIIVGGSVALVLFFQVLNEFT
jgi:hypothetical protein